MKKILLVSSSGGHFDELMIINNAIKKMYDVKVVTEKTKYNHKENYFFLYQVNRKKISSIFKLFINHIKSFIILKKINPDVVISTGALASISMCKLAHNQGKKVIFIESFAKVFTPTKTGRYVYKFADIFIVQWEELLKFYPKAVCFGGIY